jgi:predicted metal-dependent hydrolase
MPAAERRAALDAGLAAYGRGDFFLAHEILEPAWMGAEDVAERELLQGVIKLSAAYVHHVRGNPAGVAKNLRGALARIGAGAAAGAALGIDAAALASAIRARLDAPGLAEPPVIPIPGASRDPRSDPSRKAPSRKAPSRQASG